MFGRDDCYYRRYGNTKKIAQKIREKKGDYVLALKGNHSTLHNDIRLFLSSEIKKPKERTKITECFEACDKGHGRVEQRICYVSDQIDWLENRSEWKDLKSIVALESRITTHNKTTTEVRYFISSLKADAQNIAKAVRDHWSIENSLHWVLDVTLQEDNSRVKKDHAPENMAMIRHIILNMLQNAKRLFKKDMSLKGLQKKAGWGESTLSTILTQNF